MKPIKLTTKMKKHSLLLLLALVLGTGRLSAQLANPEVMIGMLPAGGIIPVGTTFLLDFRLLNFGFTTVTAGCAQFTMSVPPTLVQILDLVPSPAFTGVVMGGGSSIVLTNTMPMLGFPNIDVFNMQVRMQTIATGGPQTIRFSFAYDPAQPSCALLGDAVPGTDDAADIIVVANPLPVSLVSFQANAQANRTVDVAWRTASETNNRGFLVERSKDLRQFERVAELSEVAPNSDGLKHYKLTDTAPYWGTSYYRLTQTDLSGKATRYPAVSVVVRDGTYGVFPNPVVDQDLFRVSLDEPETALINFYSVDGRLVPVHNEAREPGHLVLKTGVPLSAGVYMLTVEERGQTRQHRIVIK